MSLVQPCEEEPIRTPGSIQAHGFLLVLDRATMRLLGVSENVSAFAKTTAEGLLKEEGIQPFFTSASWKKIYKHLSASEPLQDKAWLEVQLNSPRKKGAQFNLSIHVHQEKLYLEFEQATQSNNTLLDTLSDMITPALAFDRCVTVEDVLEKAVHTYFEMSDFDRVMLYKFDQHWNGTVLLEYSKARTDSYLGLSFPASDIPPQARALYHENRTRWIADVDFETSPLLSHKDVTFDLTPCGLRSVSPIHLQYLRNLKVAASFSVSILVQGKLWGLIVAHNKKPKALPFHTRLLFKQYGYLFSSRLALALCLEEADEVTLFQKQLSSLLKLIKREGGLLPAIKENPALLFRLFKIDGLALYKTDANKAEQSLFLGTYTNSEHSLIHPVLQAIRHHQGQQLLITDAVAQTLPHLPCLQPPANTLNLFGLIYLPLSNLGTDCLFLYRSEIHKTVTWAGAPTSSKGSPLSDQELMSVNNQYYLSPRRSFQHWKLQVKGQSEAWPAYYETLMLLFKKEVNEQERELKHQRRQTELLQATAEAKEANRTKSEFLAMMSHEIRTPMNGLLGLMELLLKSKVSKQQKDYLLMMQSSGRGLLVLINDLLDFSKIEADKLELILAPYSLRKVLDDVLYPLELEAKKKGLSLRCKIEEALPETLVGDFERLKQIVSNLVSNAVKFTTTGGVQITFKLKALQEDNLLLICQIKDTGPGIAPEKLKLVFEPFTQAGSFITRQYGGTGLGLTITASLLKKMGGFIEVDSEEGQGSTFSFVLKQALPPNAETATKKSEQLCMASQPDEEVTLVQAANRLEVMDLVALNEGERFAILKGARVLVAEDNLINQTVTKTMLKEVGMEVVVVDDGEKAVGVFKTQTIDVILMDLQMPVLDGLEATLQIRQLEKVTSRRLPIIALTANALKDDEEQCWRHGMNGYIAKPFTSAVLYDTLIKALEEARKPVKLRAEVLERLALFKELLPIFDSTYPKAIEALDTALQQEAYEPFFKTIHSLKSTVSFFTVDLAYPTLKRIELDKDKPDARLLAFHLMCLKQELQALQTLLHNELLRLSDLH